MGNENILLFFLEEQFYGIPVKHVESIVNMVAIEWVKQSSVSQLGFINFHGTPIEIVNLREKWALSFRPEKLEDKLILVSYEDKKYALWVDGVFEVVSLDTTQVSTESKFFQLGIGGIITKADGQMIRLITDLKSMVCDSDAIS